MIFAGHQLTYRLGHRTGLPGAQRGGAGEAEGGVEGGAEEDRGGDSDTETSPHGQRATCCW